MNKILLILTVLMCMVSCSSLKSVEQSVRSDTVYINKVQTEFVQRIDSVYVQDSVITNLRHSGDTIFSEVIKYKVKVIKVSQNANMKELKDSVRTRIEYVYKDKVVYVDKPWYKVIKDNLMMIGIGMIILIVIWLMIKFWNPISNILGEVWFSLRR